MNKITNNWVTSRIDEYFDIQQGKQVSVKNRQGNNQKAFLRTANIFWSKIDISKLDHMHFSYKEEAKFKLLEGDLLVCEGGDVGRSAIWHNQVDQCYYQNHLHRLRKKKANIDENFFHFWLLYAFTNNIYFGRANITTIPNLSKSRLSELEFPVPDLNEQKNITSVLSSIQKAIEIQEKIIKTTTELKKALMQKLFTEGLYGEKQKLTEIGLIPESWSVLELKTIADKFVGGGTPSTSNKSYWDGSIPWITSKWLNDKIYLIDGEKNMSEIGLINSTSNIVNRNNLIFATRVGVGKIGINTIDLAINQDLSGIEIDKNKYNLLFLTLQLLSARVQKYIDLNKRGATIQGITREHLKNIKLAIPNHIKEQEQIATIFLNLITKSRLHSAYKLQLEKLFNSMLHKLMTGEIRINNL